METIKGKQITSVVELVKGKKYWIDYVGYGRNDYNSCINTFNGKHFVDNNGYTTGIFADVNDWFKEDIEDGKINVYEWIELEIGKKYNVKFIGKDWIEEYKGKTVIHTFGYYGYNADILGFYDENNENLPLDQMRIENEKNTDFDMSVEISEYTEPTINQSEIPQIKSINIERNGDYPDTYSIMVSYDDTTSELSYCDVKVNKAKHGVTTIEVSLANLGRSRHNEDIAQ